MKKRCVNSYKLFRVILSILVLSILVFGFLPLTTMGATITDSDPDDGATKVDIEKWIIVRFNATMDTESVEKNLKISPDLDPYGYRLEWADDDTELIIKPNSAFKYSEEYTISFAGAEDTQGNSVSPSSFSFKTEASPGVLGLITGMFSDLWNSFLEILPNLVLLIIVIILGYLVAKLASFVFSKTLKKLGFDRAMDKVGVGEQLKSFGLKSASKFLGIFIFWFIFVIVIQIAISAVGVPTITDILAPIVLFIPRILIAAIIILIGLYVANFIAQKVLAQLGKTEIGKQLKIVDKKTKTAGISIVWIVSIFIKIFILLFFVEIALEIVNIGLLSEFITPVLLIMPLILLALFIILIGLFVTEIISKAIVKLIKEFQIHKLIRPVEKTIGRKGIILDLFIFIVRVLVMLIFIQLAIGVLNQTGAFNPLAELINVIILWIPNVFAALIIILIGFWVAGWAHKKVLVAGKKMDIPFPQTTATAFKFLIIYLAGVMAIAQLGFEVPILYVVTAIVLGAIFIGLGAGFAYGTKDLFANIGGYLQNKKILKVGQHVTVDGKYSGKIKIIGRYTTTLVADNGDRIIIPNAQLMKSVIVESPSASQT